MKYRGMECNAKQTTLSYCYENISGLNKYLGTKKLWNVNYYTLLEKDTWHNQIYCGFAFTATL